MARQSAEKRRAYDNARYENDPEYRERVKQARRDYYQANREKVKARAAAHRRDNPGRVRRAEIKRRYGLSIEQWDAMLIAQSGRCGICLDPMQDPHVDHDHSTGAVRELLCSSCNNGLGRFRDDPERLERAAAYLRAHA